MARTKKIETSKGPSPDGAQPSKPFPVRRRSAEQSAADYKNYQTLVARTVEAFGDEIKASRWLSLPSQDFQGKTPLEVSSLDGYGLKAIEPVLIRIEHGVDY